MNLAGPACHIYRIIILLNKFLEPIRPSKKKKTYLWFMWMETKANTGISVCTLSLQELNNLGNISNLATLSCVILSNGNVKPGSHMCRSVWSQPKLEIWSITLLNTLYILFNLIFSILWGKIFILIQKNESYWEDSKAEDSLYWTFTVLTPFFSCLSELLLGVPVLKKDTSPNLSRREIFMTLSQTYNCFPLMISEEWVCYTIQI